MFRASGLKVRRGITTGAAALAVGAMVILGIVAYVYISNPGGGSGVPGRQGTAAPLISYAADAYAVEATALLNGFSHDTGIPTAPVKSAGSFADASQIAAGAPDDVFISVALTATDSAHLKSLSSNWAIGFASDQLVLAYSNTTSSRSIALQGAAASGSNSSSGWNAFFSSLVSGKVKVGIGDPLEDPAGLRGWIALQVAGYLYAGGNQNAYSEELIRSGSNVTGTNAAALVAPLESGQIQFLFIYRSAAMADHLAFVALDSHVNFGSPALAGFYSRFSYAGTAGAPIILCVTVPQSSTNSAEATEFVQYLVRNAGVLSSYGIQPFVPSRLYNSTAVPAAIQSLLAGGLIIESGPLP